MGNPLAQERPLRREREVNWGDKTELGAGKPKTLAWVSVEESASMIVYVTARVGAASPPGTVVVVNVEWGHGGASVSDDYPVVKRLRVPVAASMVKLTGRLEDGNGNPAARAAKADVAAMIAPGSDGETMRNTTWIAQVGAEGVVSRAPERVMRVEGYNAGAASCWAMLFDKEPELNDFPLMATPAPAGERFAIERFDSHAFLGGVWWAASSTPRTLTKLLSAELRVDVELLL